MEAGGLKLGMSLSERRREKLVIFNVLGTLLDSSLRVENNLNSKIRPIVKTKSRRVVFRSWLHAFLSRCFIHFAVAFWGSKSATYMDEVVPTVMGWNVGGPQFSPLFVWRSKHCEAVEFQGGIPIAWGKSLLKVYEKWPQFNATNTLIIDNKVSQVSCNPSSNVIISSPFYVAELDKLADDKNFLKSTLWPVLETFESAIGTDEFRSRSLGIPQNTGNEGRDFCMLQSPLEHVLLVEGKGTCVPCGTALVTSSHLLEQAKLMVFVRLCKRRWRKTRRKQSHRWLRTRRKIKRQPRSVLVSSSLNPR